jgi:hypothetical protein
MVIGTRSATVRRGVNPRDYVFAVIDDPLEASRAVEALRQAGFDEDEVVVLDGRAGATGDEYENPQPQDRSSPLAALLAGMVAGMEASLDPGAFHERHLEHVRLGHGIVQVYAPGPQKFERGIAVLEAFHAHAV